MTRRNEQTPGSRSAAPSATGQQPQEALAHTARRALVSSLARLGTGRGIFIICLLAVLAYANSLSGDFVFDDAEQIVENHDIRSWSNFEKAFTTHVWQFRDRPEILHASPPLPYYRPLFTVMLTAEFQLFGLWPQGWHLVSLMLHILCAVVFYYVALLMSGRKLIALFSAVLFSVHPVHAESVSWISGMTDPLFGVFCLASFYFYLKARATTNRRMLAISLIMFLLSAFAKETALSLVLLIFGYEMVEPRASKRLAGAAKRALPYAAIALIYLIPRYLVLGESMWSNPQAPDRPLAHTILTLPFVLWSYLSHLVWPVGLSVTYATRFVASAKSPAFLLPAAGLALTCGMLFVFRNRVSREVWKALLLILIPLLPVLNLGQVSREEYLVFDHYLYLPVAGFSYLLAVAFYRVGALEPSGVRITKWNGRAPRFAVALFVMITIACTVAAARENRPWTDSYSLWSNVARLRPDYWAGYYNAGLALLNDKRFAEARELLARSRDLKTDEAGVLDALGRAYAGLGDNEAAAEYFTKAIAIDPELVESYNNLGTVYFATGRYSLAEASFLAALKLKPGAVASRFNLGLCYSRMGRYADAAREFDRVVDASEDADAYYQLGLAYEHIGRKQDAVENYQRALALAASDSLRDELHACVARLRQSDN